MGRRKKREKREIIPDPKYNNVMVAKFINHLMSQGKKSTVRRVVYNTFELVEKKSKKDALEVFDEAIRNVSPILEVRSKRVGGATYQVPVNVRAERKITLAMRWIVDAAKNKKGKPMAEKLSTEIIDAANSTGIAIKKKSDIHKMAEANRAFAHFVR
jgi:small subunit ribosomal protein S7